MRKRREWRENAAMWAVAVLAVLISSPAVIYVHENAPQWESPAVFIALGLSLVPALWYWHVRRYGWLATIISAPLFFFSLMLAIFHGWETQVQALLGVASIVFVVVMVVLFARLRRSVESLMRNIGEDAFGDPLFRREILFRDDGQRIAVYPRRRRLVINCVIYLAILGIIGLSFIWWRKTGSTSVEAIVVWTTVGLLACLIANYLLAHVYRLIVRKPTLIVGPDGILDDGMLIWSGVELLRWTEILAVTPDTRKQGFATYHYLSILVTDLPAIRRRQPILKRFGLRIAAYTAMSCLLIPQWMLETSIDDLAEQINQYVETHAPPEWFDDEVREVEARNDAATEA